MNDIKKPEGSMNQPPLARNNSRVCFLNDFDLAAQKSDWIGARPYNHIVIDNFFRPEVVKQLVEEFPAFDHPSWYVYENPLEIKKALNLWDRFGPLTYQTFYYLNSPDFIKQLEQLTDCDLFPDFGLYGGGLHSHKSGGKLNVHLDYSIHPKLQLERRLNLIIYMTPDWQEEWGGQLGMWAHDEASNQPKELVQSISPVFNRAVLFDTSQNSWHGLPEPITCPPHIMRNSFAIYYHCAPRTYTAKRGKALFTPYKEQRNDPDVMKLIEKRASLTESSTVYRKTESGK